MLAAQGAMEEPIHGSQREDIKQYLRRMERVIAQAEELHSHTVVQSNSSMRRSNFSRRRSYSGNGSCPEEPAGAKEPTNPLRRSYCVGTDGCREPAACLPGRELTAAGSRTAEALLDSGATLSDWMDEEAVVSAQPSAQRLGLGATGQPDCAASPISGEVLLDPEACLTFRIGSDGVPVSESDCDSVLIASPVRGGIDQVYGTPPRRGPSTVASPLSRGYVTAAASPAPSLPQEEFSPARNTAVQDTLEEQAAKFSPHSYPVTISANTFCASEQPSQSLAASQSHLTSSVRNGLIRPAAPIEAHAVSDTMGTLGGKGDTADTADSGGSEGDPFLTPEDSAQGNGSAGTDHTHSQVSTGAYQPPCQHMLTQHDPLSADDTAALLGVEVGEGAAVADVVRFLASASSSNVSRRADSASASMGSTAVGVIAPNGGHHRQRKQAADETQIGRNGGGDAYKSAANSSSLKGSANTAAPVAVHGKADPEGGDAKEERVSVAYAAGSSMEGDSQGAEPGQASKDQGERKRSALEKLKGRLRNRQQDAVSRSREKLVGGAEPEAMPIAAPSSAADDGAQPQPWPSQPLRSPLKSLSRPVTPRGESPSRIPRPSSASSQPGSPRIRAMIPSRLPRPPTPGTPKLESPRCPVAVHVARFPTPRSPGRVPNISPEPSRPAPLPATTAAAVSAPARPFPHPPSGLSRPGSARPDFHLADDGAVTFPGVSRRTSAAELDALTSDGSLQPSSNGPASSGCTSSGSAHTLSQERSGRSGRRSRAASSSTGSSCTAESKAGPTVSAAPASPRSVSSKAAQRVRHMGPSEAGGSNAATVHRRAAASCASDGSAVLPSRPSTSPPQASRSTSSSAVNGDLRSSGKQTAKNGSGYSNIKPRTNSHLDLNYIPVTKPSRRQDVPTVQSAAAKPAWGTGGTSATSGAGRSERSTSTKAEQLRDGRSSARGRETTMQPAEKLPYDALLGHVTNLLTEVRTALRQ